MSPRWLKQGASGPAIGGVLHQFMNQRGSIVMNAAVKTGKGTKVADVAWFSAERWAQVQDEFDASIAPEICVEVLSLRNAPGEIAQKKQLYFDAGALEV